MKYILIMGSIPPPIGGVTIHIQRLLLVLAQEGIPIVFTDYSRQKFKSLARFLKAPVIHVHFSNKVIRALLVCLGFLLLKRVIITFHGKYNFLNFWDKCSLHLCYKAIVLNEFSLNSAQTKVDNNKVVLMSAFIPPDLSKEENTIRDKETLINWLKEFSEVFCTNAHNLIFDKNGNDLYGIDFLIEAFSRLQKYALLISDPSGKLKAHYKDSTSNIFFISYPHSFIEVIKMSNIILRATTSDGDSLSLKEALYMNKKAIASDCVDRPKGCVLYKTLSLDSFLQVIDERNVTSNGIGSVDTGSIKLMNLYRDLLR